MKSTKDGEARERRLRDMETGDDLVMRQLAAIERDKDLTPAQTLIAQMRVVLRPPGACPACGCTCGAVSRGPIST